MTYLLLGDVEAMSAKWTYVSDGAAWTTAGCVISEDAWDKAVDHHDVPPPPKCPHCSRDFHTDPLTERVAGMVRNHKFDPAYRAAEDESPVECVGSDTYGPNRPYVANTYTITGYGGGGGSAVWMDNLITSTIAYASGAMATLILPKWDVNFSWPAISWNEWFSPAEELPACPPDLEIDVQFGPEHWPVEHVALFPPHLDLVAKVHPNEWREPIPLPASPGLDVSTLVEEFNKKHNWNGVNK